MPKQLKQNLKKLKKNNFSDWVQLFNEKHNKHLYTSIGTVEVRTENNKRVYKNIKEHGTDITYENEFKVSK